MTKPKSIFVYYWNGTKKFNAITGFNDRIATRSDGKSVKLSAKRMGELFRAGRMIFGD